LGIEAFSLSQGEVIPDMDLIADFSELVKQEWNAGCLQAAHAAQIYFNEAKDRPELWFEFTLMQRE
jgi:hypothetical protein